MKVTLLLAQCSSELLKKSVACIAQVLQDLEVEVHRVALHRLPYYEGTKNRQMEEIMAAVKESQGVIAVSSVPMLGMHGAMQNFFDQATLYEMACFDKPILAVTCSKWLGEQEAAQMIQKCWGILGGMEGGSVFMNEALPHEPYLQRLEKEIENFYRLMKQERPNIGSSERLFYYRVKEDGGNQPSPKAQQIDVSAKEQTIKTLASLLEKETKEEDFVSMHTGVYTRPPQIVTGVTGPKRLQQIPHYFIAQHDKAMDLVLKYQLIDLEEQGYIVIHHGDCVYQDTCDKPITVEMILQEKVLQEILSHKITYQKAFMLGRLKVKGNFSILPKLDQIFKSL